MTLDEVTHDEAEQLALACIDKVYGNPEKPGRRWRASIPANPREDTDLRLMAYIRQQRAKGERRAPEQPVPPEEETRERREAAAQAMYPGLSPESPLASWVNGSNCEPYEGPVARVAQLLATRERAAFERGRKSAQGGALSGSELVKELTRALRLADTRYQETGGSTRHYVNECLVGELERAGLAVVRLPPPPSDQSKGSQ